MAQLTREELVALFEASVDPDFARELLSDPDSAAAVEASAEVFAASSDAVERTSQSFFLRPWSGQTYPPATGAARATVTESLSRLPPADDALVLLPGLFFVEEQEADFGEDGGALVPTGRRYTPAAAVAMVPGVSTLSAPFVAERPGAGYNLPPAGSISLPVDVGGATGEQATLVPGASAHRLLLAPEGETIPPSSVGQYVALTAGANAGQRRRIVSYEQPDPDFPHNGVAVLAPTLVLAVSAVAGAFAPGERVEESSTGAAAVLVAAEGGYLVADRLELPAFAPGSIVGVQSGATATVDAVLGSPDMAAESATAGWALLDWAAGVGLSASNPDRPSGGASPTLDHIGGEEGVNRSPGEADEPYRKRVADRPDVVSPNALVRAMNRILAPFGLSGCLREPSDLDTFAGFFYDAPAAGPEARRYAYDMDFDLRPSDRYKLPLDLAEFRAFFVASVPPMSLGEFGFAYDQGFVNAYDSAPFLSFYDGYPATAAAVRIAIWNALDGKREAGVGFDLVEDRFGC
jgi:hypothetical protein